MNELLNRLRTRIAAEIRRYHNWKEETEETNKIAIYSDDARIFRDADPIAYILARIEDFVFGIMQRRCRHPHFCAIDSGTLAGYCPDCFGWRDVVENDDDGVYFDEVGGFDADAFREFVGMHGDLFKDIPVIQLAEHEDFFSKYFDEEGRR